MNATQIEAAKSIEVLLVSPESKRIDEYRQAATEIEQLLAYANIQEERRWLENLQIVCRHRELILQPASFLGSSACNIPVGILKEIIKFKQREAK